MKKIDDVPFEKDLDTGKIINNNANRKHMYDLLNAKGPGFCLAKWTQVTMHLGVGLTHSCHHPGAHKIPLEEIEKNPGALHNTIFKKYRRKEMLDGKRPSECEFCWRIEDNTKEYSDRVYKSLDQYSIHDHDKIAASSGNEDFYPRYVEISFGNVCNFKCSYCGPTFSSKWVEEINSHGRYEFHDATNFNAITDTPIPERETNPYIDAFWKWFPDAVEHMHTFRITGGEPLLSKHTMRVMDHLLQNPQPNLEFSINTNGNPPQAIWIAFTKKINQMVQNNCIKKFTLFTSAESSGNQAEYSRFGMDWNAFQDNIEYFLDNTSDTRVAFMSAFNILSLPTFLDFLKWILMLKQRYNASGLYSWFEECKIDTRKSLPYGGGKDHIERSNMSRVGIDIPYVRNPVFLDSNIATRQMVEDYLLPATEFMFRNSAASDWDAIVGFEAWECAKLKRILIDILCAIKDSTNPDNTTTNVKIGNSRVKFVDFITEYDKRRKTSFFETFPEMKEFFDVCLLEKQKRLYE